MLPAEIDKRLRKDGNAIPRLETLIAHPGEAPGIFQASFHLV